MTQKCTKVIMHIKGLSITLMLVVYICVRDELDFLA